MFSFKPVKLVGPASGMASSRYLKVMQIVFYWISTVFLGITTIDTSLCPPQRAHAIGAEMQNVKKNFKECDMCNNRDTYKIKTVIQRKRWQIFLRRGKQELHYEVRPWILFWRRSRNFSDRQIDEKWLIALDMAFERSVFRSQLWGS